MRVTLFAIGMILSSFHASFAFEVEDHRIYMAPMPTQTIRVISTADIAAFDPLIRTFQSINQGITVDYTVASSTEVMAAIYEEGAPFDLVISSAMDLQTKLVNDGFAQRYVRPKPRNFRGGLNGRTSCFLLPKNLRLWLFRTRFLQDWKYQKTVNS